jgi:hypothetical protein
MNPFGDILLKAMAVATVTYFTIKIAIELAPTAYAGLAW